MPKSSPNPQLLFQSELVQRLSSLEETISPFEVYGIESNELVHSRVLGRLLSGSGKLGFGAQLMPRLAAACRVPGTHLPLNAGLQEKLSSARFRASLEHVCMTSNGDIQDLGRMDILLEDESRKIAVVIENKIWAGEQSEQITRYQKWLATERPTWTTLVIYLTPSGGRPNEWDASRQDLPPCASLSWHRVHSVLQEVEEQDTSGVVRVFRQNIQRHIMGDTIEKQLVREIMSKPDLAAVVRTIIDNMPKLEDIQSEIEHGVREITGMEIETKLWPPKRGDVREILIYLKPWRDAGIPICFNFYDGDLPAMRTMVHVDKWPTFEPVAKKLSSYENSAIHESCPVRQEWRSWRLVMADESDTNESWMKTTISDRSFSPESAKELLAIFRERFEKLKPTIDLYLAEVKDKN